ncbi:MAG: hypothetical protein OEW44_02335 [Gemmatimonadota bacterium]|nr:hypothetical protein [Gemmatimonadota bacterium]
MMRMLLPVAMAGALLALPTREPQPKLDRVDVTMQGALVKVRGYFRSGGNPDSNITTLTATGTALQRHGLPGSATRDSFTVARPAPGATMAGQFCVQSTKRAWNPAPPVCAGWSYLEPAVLPPPVVDSVRADTLIVGLAVRPTTATLLPGQQQQMCGFVIFGDGQVVQRSVEQGNAVCDGFYRGGWALTQRQPTAAQQAKADRTCLHWVATGGTVTLEPCDPMRGA